MSSCETKNQVGGKRNKKLRGGKRQSKNKRQRGGSTPKNPTDEQLLEDLPFSSRHHVKPKPSVPPPEHAIDARLSHMTWKRTGNTAQRETAGRKATQKDQKALIEHMSTNPSQWKKGPGELAATLIKLDVAEKTIKELRKQIADKDTEITRLNGLLPGKQGGGKHHKKSKKTKKAKKAKKSKKIKAGYRRSNPYPEP